MHAITFTVRNVHVDPPGLTLDSRWKVLVNVDADDFSFDSMDFEDAGIVRFERRGAGFAFASCFETAPSETILEPAAVDAFVAAFDAFTTETLTRDLGLDLAALFDNTDAGGRPTP